MNIHIAAGFDGLTKLMMGWLASITGEAAKGLFGKNASRDELLHQIEEGIGDNNLVVVFYGHGVSSALLTEARLGSGAIGNDKSYLCFANDFERRKRVDIFAYCCWSALEMGADIRNGGHGRYLGFRGELPFLTAPAEEGAFERSIKNVVLNISREKCVYDDSVKDLLFGFRAEHRKWLDGEYSAHDRSMMVCMCLEEQARLLDRRI